MASAGTLDGVGVGRVGRRIGRLRRLHQGRVVTQEEFAARIGISVSYLRKIEQGRRDVTLGVLFRAARELGVDPMELIRPAGRAPGLEEVQVPLLRLLARLRRQPEGIPMFVSFLNYLGGMLRSR